MKSILYCAVVLCICIGCRDVLKRQRVMKTMMLTRQQILTRAFNLILFAVVGTGMIIFIIANNEWNGVDTLLMVCLFIVTLVKAVQELLKASSDA